MLRPGWGLLDIYMVLLRVQMAAGIEIQITPVLKRMKIEEVNEAKEI